ncbi:RNA pseudouridylate synthase domain-containing protein 1 isoform X1 [Sergentomyia squamirostris]
MSLFYFDSLLQVLGSTIIELSIEHVSHSISCVIIPQCIHKPPLQVIYSSQNFIVVLKPPDVTEVALWKKLTEQLDNVGDRDTQRAIFRRCFQSDNGFSGLYPVAVNKLASGALKNALAEINHRRRLHTYYVAIVKGLVEQPEIKIDAQIGRDLRFKNPIVRMCTNIDWEHCFNPCDCTTEVVLVETGYFDEEFSSKVVLKSYRDDRKQQFRVHLKEVGHPLVGDTIYDESHHPKTDHLMIELIRVRSMNSVENLFVDSEDPFTVEKLSGRWRVKDTVLQLQDALEKLDSLEAF